MSLSTFLTIAALSMIPVTELRIVIPTYIIGSPHLPILFIFTAAVIGNMIPNFFLLWFFPRFTDWLHNKFAPWLNKFIHSLHDFFIKKDHIWIIYVTIILILSGSVELLYSLSVSWHTALIILTIELFVIIFTHILLQKIFDTSHSHKSIIHWFYGKVHKKHSKKFYKWGSLALIAIVALPLPGTGSWTGSLIAFLMGISYWKALGLILIGILIAATIVTGLSTGIMSGLELF
jgi:uncharacterized membrane protein